MIIRDIYGRPFNWYRSDNDFTYAGIEYIRDTDNGRCYELRPSENMNNPNMSGALVKKRIKTAYYETYLQSVKLACKCD